MLYRWTCLFGAYSSWKYTSTILGEHVLYTKMISSMSAIGWRNRFVRSSQQPQQYKSRLLIWRPKSLNWRINRPLKYTLFWEVLSRDLQELLFWFFLQKITNLLGFIYPFVDFEDLHCIHWKSKKIHKKRHILH